MTSAAYKKCLFSSEKDKNKALERMNSLQSLNLTFNGEGSTMGQTVDSTEAYTRETFLRDNMMQEEGAIFFPE